MEDENEIKIVKPKEVKSISAKIKIFFAALIAVVIAISIFLGISLKRNSPQQRLMASIRNNDYKSAVIIREKIHKKLNSKVLDLLSDKLSDIKIDFSEGNLDLETSLKNINYIKGIGDDDTVSLAIDVENSIKTLDNSRKSYAKALAEYQDGNYAEAIVLLKKVVDYDYENYTSAQKYLSDSYEKYVNEIVMSTDIMAANGDVSEALNELENALILVPNNKNIINKINEYKQAQTNNEIEKCINSVEEHISNEEYVLAIHTIEEFKNKYGTNNKLDSMLSETADKYVELVLSKANELQEKQKFQEEIIYLEEAQRVIPLNMDIKNKLAAVKSLQISNVTKELNIDNAVYFDNHVYCIYDIGMTWLEAENYCVSKNGHLISINSKEEQKFALELAQSSYKDNFWIGGYLDSLQNVWKWTDNSSFEYTNWFTRELWDEENEIYVTINEPDNYLDKEYYIRFANKDIDYPEWSAYEGEWNDTANAGDDDAPINTFGFICEWSLEQ